VKQIRLGHRAVLTKGDAVEALAALPESCVDLIWTDPPYGHDNNASGDLVSRREAALGQGEQALGEERGISSDDFVAANALFTTLRREAARILVPGGTLCVCCGGGGGPDDIQLARWSLKLQRTKGLMFKQIVTWDKGPIGMGWHYRRSVEVILVASRTGAKPRWLDRSRTVENIIRPGAYGIKKILPGKNQHPTEKPVELPALFIRLHTSRGDLVVDPFMGSGAAGVAALTMGRRFLGVELDPHWYKVAARRIRSSEAAGVDTGSEICRAVRGLKPLRDTGCKEK
jgi:site-specific DNA-methyltransferase (adenine-specific)